MVSIQIFSESDANEMANAWGGICHQKVLVDTVYETTTDTNLASYLVHSSNGHQEFAQLWIRQPQDTGYPDYHPQSRMSMDVYDKNRSQCDVGYALKEKIKELLKQLNNPVVFSTAGLLAEGAKPLSIDDL